MAKFPRLKPEVGATQNLSDVWTQVQRTAADVHRQATVVRERIVSGTQDGRPRPVNASALLDGLWDRRNAFPEWKRQLKRLEPAIRSPELLSFARQQRMDPTLDLAASLDRLLPALDAVVAWVGDFFGTVSGKEPSGTIEYVNGERKSKQWPANDPALQPLVPLLDAVLAAIE